MVEYQIAITLFIYPKTSSALSSSLAIDILKLLDSEVDELELDELEEIGLKSELTSLYTP
ncbi:MAG: hypothetical protein EOM41_12240 [Bacilli bacterium]|nr:hypothetical protein [Bacilli bacterium]